MWITFDGGGAWNSEGKALVAVGCVVSKVRATAIESARLLLVQLGCLVTADEFELGSPVYWGHAINRA